MKELYYDARPTKSQVMIQFAQYCCVT